MGRNDHLNDTVIERKTCQHCGKDYIQWTEDQVPGFRVMDEDICPYCGEENGHSMEVEYHNTRIEQA